MNKAEIITSLMFSAALWIIVTIMTLYFIGQLVIVHRADITPVKHPETPSKIVITYKDCRENIPIPEEPVLEEIKEIKRYYDVPLNEELQDHIFNLCAAYDINPALVISLIGKESSYRSDAIGDGGDSLGLMQIQPKWNQARMEELGCSDLIDPFQNVEVGIDILAELFATGKSTEWVLMAYNGGRAYANDKQSLGIVSDYANTIIANSHGLNTYEVG